MKTTLRTALAGLAVLALTGAASAADPWPAKPIRFVVPYPPGGPTDLMARPLSGRLAEAIEGAEAANCHSRYFLIARPAALCGTAARWSMTTGCRLGNCATSSSRPPIAST